MSHASGGYYEIKVEPHVDQKRSGYFDGLDIVNLPSGETVLSGHIEDVSKLFSLLSSIRDMGLALISINKREEE